MKRKLKVLFLLLAIASIFIGCKPLKEKLPSLGKKEDKPEITVKAPEEASFNIKTTVVKRGNISSKLMLSGDVEASASVDVYPEANGELSELYVKVGDWVTKNQVIAKVDPSRPGMNYAENPIDAPINGTITAINADIGATVGVQMPLITVGDISRLVISTKIPERFIYMVEKGQTAWITTTAAPGNEYRAKVSSISPVLNPSSRTLAIELEIIGTSPIKAGMFVGIELRTSVSENSLIIPEKAVLTRDEGSYVYLINDDRALKTVVATGIRDDGLIEIKEGLSEGDIIATDGVSLLSNGVKVRILSDGENK